MKKCEVCGSLIIETEDITALCEKYADWPDPTTDRTIINVGEKALELRMLGSWTKYSSTMMICSSCGKHVPYHKYQYCPHCGSKNKMEVAE
jgi:uncharacterized OB-fold protein